MVQISNAGSRHPVMRERRPLVAVECTTRRVSWHRGARTVDRYNMTVSVATPRCDPLSPTDDHTVADIATA